MPRVAEFYVTAHCGRERHERNALVWLAKMLRRAWRMWQ